MHYRRAAGVLGGALQPPPAGVRADDCTVQATRRSNFRSVEWRQVPGGVPFVCRPDSNRTENLALVGWLTLDRTVRCGVGLGLE